MVTRVPTRMITTTGVQAGSYTAADITVNEAGQITSAASNSVVVSGGGGPKITGVTVTDNAWTAIDDTAVDVLGGYIKITGSGFSNGCLVYFNQTAASSVSFVSSTELRVTTGALSAGTYVVYAINTDGGVAISVPGVTFSASPSWQTASTLTDQYDGVAITLSLIASDATSYTLVSGSLPPGLSLNASTGAITGTVVGVTVDTTYTFTVRATDAQNQDSPRTFTVTITVSDPYFNRTTLLLSGSALTTNTVLRDSSTNNFNLTAYGDARASNFSPYGTGWSNYFDGTGDYLSLANNAAFDMGSGDFTIDCWFYLTSDASPDNDGLRYATIFSSGPSTAVNSTDYSISLLGNTTTTGTGIGFGGRNSGTIYDLTHTATITKNIWHYVCVVRSGSTLTLYYDGTQVAQNTNFTSNVNTGGNQIRIGALAWFPSGQNYAYYFPGYISALKVVKGVANTPSGVPSAPPTQSTGTSLLTCQSNRFLDASTNNFAITKNGDTTVTTFNPFGITNTGTSGSAYFDGTGDYISVANNSAFNIGINDFTIEAFIYLDDLSTNRIISSIYQTPTGSDDQHQLGLTTANIVFLTLVSGVTQTNLSFSIGYNPSKAWNHIAISRQSGFIKCFWNGIQIGNTEAYSSSLNQGSVPLVIGDRANDTIPFKGYISNYRYVNGTAVYTANFTPPTQQLTAIANTQLLTLQYKQPHNNHSFQDSSTNNHLITRNGNATQGSFSPFSPAGWSVYFIDTSSHNISAVTGAETSPGTGDFCAELWYWTSKSGNQALIGNLESETETQWVLTLITGGVIRIQGWINTYVSGTSGPLNSWNHVAVCRSGTTMSIFVNGSRVGTATVTNNFSGTSNIRVGGPNGIDYFLGYISNARFVKGSSVYDPTQVSITVPTGPLTAITNTKFLVCQSNRLRDISSNNFTLTTSGSPQVRAFSPFAPTAVYNPVTHGGSGYLDGSGDYFILTNESAYDFGDGNFSIDFWYYPLSAQGYGGIYMRDGQDQPLGIYSGTSMTPAWPECVMNVGTTTTWFATGINTSGVQKYAWNHIAFTRVGNTFRAFTNGILSSVVTASGTMGSGGTPWIGKNGTAAGLSELSMYLSGFRMTKGGIPTLFSTSSTTTGTTIFAVPTQPFTANDSLTGGSLSILANFADAAVIDSSGRQILETVGNAQISTTQSKFDGSSIYLDGNGDYLYSPANPLNILGTADFTIEMWAYVTDYTTASPTYNDYGTFIDYRTANVSQVNVLLGFLSNIGGLGRPVMYVNGAVTITGNVITTNTWTHIALCRASGVTRLFMNGNQAGSNYTDTNNYVSNLFTIGTNINRTDAFLKGYIQDPRITRGYARYTSNFTPPAVPHRLK